VAKRLSVEAADRRQREATNFFVSQAPPLSAGQVEKLRTLLGPFPVRTDDEILDRLLNERPLLSAAKHEKLVAALDIVTKKQQMKIKKILETPPEERHIATWQERNPPVQCMSTGARTDPLTFDDAIEWFIAELDYKRDVWSQLDHWDEADYLTAVADLRAGATSFSRILDSHILTVELAP
jgi:hypothetical protein